MGKPETMVEWSAAEGEEAWQAAHTNVEMHAVDVNASVWAGQTRPAGEQGERRLAALALVIVLVLAGAWAWRRQLMQAAIVDELQAAAAQEVAALPPTTQPLAVISGQALTASTQRMPSALQIEKADWRGNRAMAQMTVSYRAAEGGTLAYRESRFYLQTDAGWQRTDPDPDLIGPWQTLETEHFVIRYPALDAGAVTEAVPRLEFLYDRLHRAFVLAPITAPSPITLELAADAPPGGYTVSLAQRTIVVATPALLSVPTDVTDAAALYQSVIYPLASLLLAEAAEQHPARWREDFLEQWQPLMYALRLWALAEAEGPLADAHEEVARWLYHNAQADSAAAQRALPANHESLCRLYQGWGLSPLALSIPLPCQGVSGRPSSPRRKASLPTRLDSLFYGVSDGAAEADGVVVALETVIEYAAATYGRAQLPLLVSEVGQHERLDTLIPAVFAVSAVEFESGWQAFLADRYGAEPPPRRAYPQTLCTQTQPPVSPSARTGSTVDNSGGMGLRSRW